MALPILQKMHPCRSVTLHLLYVHGRQRQDLGPLLLPQLRRHHAADSRPNGLAHDDGVTHVSSPYFVRGADGYAVARLGAEVALLLDDYDDAIACDNQPMS
jgi:hypothetical protein